MKLIRGYAFLWVVVVLILIPSLSFAQIVVTSTADSGPGTLREAIDTIASGGETIIFNLPGAAPHTITLNTSLDIDVDLIINGPGKENLTISGNNNTRIFSIDSPLGTPSAAGISVEIRGLTISDGNTVSVGSAGGAISSTENLTLEDCELSNNVSGDGGGALSHIRGTLIITRCEFLGNMDLSNSGDSYGGAINIQGQGGFTTTGIIFLDDVIFRNNSAQGTTSGNGGAISIRGINQPDPDTVPFLYVNTVEMSNNTASGDIANGGAIYLMLAEIYVDNTNIFNNTADGTTLARGGAVFTIHLQGDGHGSYFEFETTTFSGNRARGNRALGGATATDFVGGEFVNTTFSENVVESTGDISTDFAYGGAIYIIDDFVDIVNCTIVFNIAEGTGMLDGAGIYVDRLISNPIELDLQYKNTILAGQSFNPPNPAGFLNCKKGYTGIVPVFILAPPPAFSISDDPNDDCMDAYDPGFDITTMLGPLQNNGGFVPTHALIDTVAPVNPAIDRIDPIECDTYGFIFMRNTHDLPGPLDFQFKQDRRESSSAFALDYRNFKHRISEANASRPLVGATGIKKSSVDVKWSNLTPLEMYGFIKPIGLDEDESQYKDDNEYPDDFSEDEFSIPGFDEVQRGVVALVNDARFFPRPYDYYGSGGTPLCDIGAFEIQPDGFVAISKVSEPAGGTGFEFLGLNFPLACNLNGTFILDDGETTPGCILPLGSYTVVETNNQGLNNLDINCVGSAITTPDVGNSLVIIDLMTPMDSSVCTFFNSDAPGMVALTVILQGTGTGSAVTGTPGEIDCTSTGNMDCAESYPVGEIVTLTATPDLGSTFDGWSGDCPATAMNDTTITLNVSSTCIATFSVAPDVTLDVELQGSGTGAVASTNTGIDCTSAGTMDCDETYLHGTMVTLTATPDPGSIFTGWSGDAACSGDPANPVLNLTMDMDISCIATFVLLVNLDVTIEGNGEGGVVTTNPAIDCNSTGTMDCDESYTPGTMVTLTATPLPNSNFTGWSGDAACTGDPTNPVLNLTMNMDISCIATFELIPVTLDVTIQGNGDGGVVSTNPGIDCNSSGAMDCDEVYTFNNMVTLTAAALTGSTFTGWSGDPACTGDPTNPVLNLTMDMDISCIATFVLDPVTLDVIIQGDGSCTVTSVPDGINCVDNQGDCSETYDPPGVTVDLTVVPEEPSSFFTGWSGDCSGTDTGTTITVNEDSTCIATCVLSDFVLNPIYPALDDNINFITAENAVPGRNVAFAWSKAVGSFTVGGQVCNGTQLGIKKPNLLSIAKANDFGVATYIFYIPFLGDFEFQVQLQAVDITTCRTSNIVSQIIRKEEGG